MFKTFYKNTRIISIAAFCTLISACSSTATTTSEQSTEEQEALKAKNQQALVDSGYKCKKVKLTGSHISSRVCDTRRQREDRQDDAQKMISDVVNGAPPPESQ